MSSISPGHASSSKPSADLKNVTIDDSDPSLKYSQGWQRGVSSLAFGGSFHAGDGGGDVVSFNLPDNAIAVYYFGFEQASGATYQACVDCDATGTGEVDNIEASQSPPAQEPVLLYQRTGLDPTVSHTLALLNMPVGKNTSVITVDSFVVTLDSSASTISNGSNSSSLSTSSIALESSAPLLVQVATHSSSQQQTSSSASPSTSADAAAGAISSPTSTVFIPTSSLSSTTVSSASASGTASRSQNNLSSTESAAQKMKSPFIITVAALLTLFVVCTTTYALMYFMRRRRRRRSAPKMPYMPISEQTALFFSSIKKGGERLGEVSRDIARKSVFGLTGAGALRMRDKDGGMAEKLVADVPRLPVTYGAMTTARSGRGLPPIQQVAALRHGPPPLAPDTFRKAPRSLFPPPVSQQRPSPPRSPLSPPGSARAYSPTASPRSAGAAGRPLPPRPLARPPPARIASPSPRSADYAYADPFAAAEAEARTCERGETRRASVASMESMYSDGEGWERRYDFPRTPRSADRA